jgi:hypothetical protein
MAAVAVAAVAVAAGCSAMRRLLALCLLLTIAALPLLGCKDIHADSGPAYDIHDDPGGGGGGGM